MIQLLRNAMLVCFIAFASSAMADLLPEAENLAVEGDMLVWEEVEGAAGYNIYRNYGYFDTVKEKTQYRMTQPGAYWVVAFDGAGNFGSQYGGDQVVDYTGSEDAVSVSYNYTSSVVQVTCKDVGPGESCTASCESTRTVLSPPRYSSYVSGGACSTSDIVEADAFVSNRTYQCTVPTFSGEVVAQAICVHR